MRASIVMQLSFFVKKFFCGVFPDFFRKYFCNSLILLRNIYFNRELRKLKTFLDLTNPGNLPGSQRMGYIDYAQLGKPQKSGVDYVTPLKYSTDYYLRVSPCSWI